MATVYLAVDEHHDRSVALKVLHPDLAATLGSERFQREVKLAARLQHPHILSVFDSGDANGLLWFTMPFVEGQSLRDRLSREGQLSIPDSLRIGREVALALDFAHRHGVVHRDIKPENILLIEGQAMVADFGIARAMTGEGALTQTGLAVGTPAYMSPEQASGEHGLDARADIYSLGSVIYEMLAGEPPFTGPNAQAVIARKMTEVPRAINVARNTVPLELADLVNATLARSPADRPASARDVATTLETIAASGRTGVTATMTPSMIGGRRRVWVFAAVVVALALLAPVLWRQMRSGNAYRIAVIPFDNAGGADDDYFADGMTDEVRSKLSSIPGLQVTARASTSQYKRSKKDPKDIGRELSVDYLLTGTVRWNRTQGADRVRVTPELIQVSNSAMKWSEPFDTVLSDVFAVQANIASRVANRLNIALAPPAQQRIAERPTSNLDAYDEFLKGEQITASIGTSDSKSLNAGIPHYERAVALDSSFLQAWAQLARARAYLFDNTPTVEAGERVREAAERAKSLGPNRPEAHLAMGTYLRLLKLDYEGARAEFEAGLKTDPANADLLVSIAGVDRILGRFDDALVHAQQAFKLDPRSVRTAARVPSALHDLRRFSDEPPAWDRALALAPQSLSIIQGKAFAYLSMGQLDSVHALVADKLKTVDTTALLVRFAFFQETMWALPPELWPKIVVLTVKDFDNDRGHWGLKIGHTYKLMGDTARARMFGDSARVAFEAQLKDFPDRAQLRELWARALALGGHKREAVQEADSSLKVRETTADASIRPYIRFQAARVLIQSGEYERAIDIIEQLVTMPASDVTPAYLRIDPSFAPLKGNPRFDRIVAEKR